MLSLIASGVAERVKHDLSGCRAAGSIKKNVDLQAVALKAISGGGGSHSAALPLSDRRVKRRVLEEGVPLASGGEKIGKIKLPKKRPWKKYEIETVADALSAVYLDAKGFKTVVRLGQKHPPDKLFNDKVKELCISQKKPVFSLQKRGIKGLVEKWIKFGVKFQRKIFMNSQHCARISYPQSEEAIKKTEVKWTLERKGVLAEAIKLALCVKKGKSYVRVNYSSLNRSEPVVEFLHSTIDKICAEKKITPFFLDSAKLVRLISNRFPVGKIFDFKEFSKKEIKSKVYVLEKPSEVSVTLGSAAPLEAPAKKAARGRRCASLMSQVTRKRVEKKSPPKASANPSGAKSSSSEALVNKVAKNALQGFSMGSSGQVDWEAHGDLDDFLRSRGINTDDLGDLDGSNVFDL